MRTSDYLKMVEIFSSKLGTGGNTALAIVLLSAPLKVLNSSKLGFRINIFCKNSNLRQALYRSMQKLILAQ